MGTWWTQDHDGVVEIHPCAGRAVRAGGGVIAAASRMVAAAGPARPLALPPAVIPDGKPDSTGCGTATSPIPTTTRPTRIRLRVDPDGRLRMRGYIGIPLFGQTVYWTRFDGHLTADCHLRDGCGVTRLDLRHPASGGRGPADDRARAIRPHLPKPKRPDRRRTAWRAAVRRRPDDAGDRPGRARRPPRSSNTTLLLAQGWGRRGAGRAGRPGRAAPRMVRPAPIPWKVALGRRARRADAAPDQAWRAEPHGAAAGARAAAGGWSITSPT